MKTLPPELDAKIDEIKSWMFPSGSQKEIAKRARISEDFVSKILLKMRYPTPEFMNAAIAVMNENRARFDCGAKLKVA